MLQGRQLELLLPPTAYTRPFAAQQAWLPRFTAMSVCSISHLQADRTRQPSDPLRLQEIKQTAFQQDATKTDRWRKCVFGPRLLENAADRQTAVKQVQWTQLAIGCKTDSFNGRATYSLALYRMQERQLSSRRKPPLSSTCI